MLINGKLIDEINNLATLEEVYLTLCSNLDDPIYIKTLSDTLVAKIVEKLMTFSQVEGNARIIYLSIKLSKVIKQNIDIDMSAFKTLSFNQDTNEEIKFNIIYKIKGCEEKWFVDYALDNIWCISNSEKMTRLLIDIVCKKANTLTEMIPIVFKGFDDGKSKEDLVVTHSKVLKAVFVLFGKGEVALGEMVHASINELIFKPYYNENILKLNSKSKKVLLKYSLKILRLIINTKPSIINEVRTYTPVVKMAGWFAEDVWRKYIKVDKDLIGFIELIIEIAMQHVLRNEDASDYFELLNDISNTKADYQILCGEIIKKYNLSDSHAKVVLSRGGVLAPKRKISSDDALSQRKMENLVSEVLVSMSMSDSKVFSLKDALDDVAIFDPALECVFRDLISTFEVISFGIDSLADRLSLRIKKGLGETDSFDSKFYESLDSVDFGVVIRPACFCDAGGGKRVVKKGMLK